MKDERMGERKKYEVIQVTVIAVLVADVVLSLRDRQCHTCSSHLKKQTEIT